MGMHLLINDLILCSGSGKFGEKENITAFSENTIWEITAQLLEKCTLDILHFALWEKFVGKKKKNQDVSNSDFAPIPVGLLGTPVQFIINAII